MPLTENKESTQKLFIFDPKNTYLPPKIFRKKLTGNDGTLNP